MDGREHTAGRGNERPPSATRGGLARVAGGAAYGLWLLASIAFTLPILIFQQLLPNRSAHHAKEHGYGTPPMLTVVLIDVLAALAAYWIADWIRCRYEGIGWPEVEPNFGSTLMVHVRMSAFVAVAWPTILAWLGWYRSRWRSWRWKAVNTFAASVLLGMAMGAFSMLVDRLIYPRMQIAIAVAVVPITTAILLGLCAAVLRATRGAQRDRDSAIDVDF